MAGSCELVIGLRVPKLARFGSEIADSLRQIFEIFPFSGDSDRRPGSIQRALAGQQSDFAVFSKRPWPNGALNSFDHRCLQIGTFHCSPCCEWWRDRGRCLCVRACRHDAPELLKRKCARFQQSSFKTQQDDLIAKFDVKKLREGNNHQKLCVAAARGRGRGARSPVTAASVDGLNIRL
jgi:hypothetical protein